MGYHALNDYVEQHTRNGAKNYLLIDEVQMCSNFEIAINSLHRSERYDIYLTGTNAFLLSADLATLFTGRQIEIPIFPFSFNEFCEYYGLHDQLQEALDRYVVEGGMAGSYVYRTQEDKGAYLSEVYHTILTRDMTENL